jgi:hypothetical protein
MPFNPETEKTWTKVTRPVWEALSPETPVEVVCGNGQLACGYVRQFIWAGLLHFRILAPAGLETVAEPSELESVIFSFLTRTYVQRADDRQKRLGLTYTEAETHDLAREVANFLGAAAPSYH